jgi:hypothetical protein
MQQMTLTSESSVASSALDGRAFDHKMKTDIETSRCENDAHPCCRADTFTGKHSTAENAMAIIKSPKKDTPWLHQLPDALTVRIIFTHDDGFEAGQPAPH